MSPFRKQRAQDGTRPQLQPIPAWSWMLAAVIAVAVTALVVTIWLLAIANHARPGTDQANARLDAVRTGLAAGAGAGAAVGLMLAFRRQHHQEITTTQADHDATERRITELYTKAVEQLGSDKAPVRLGGLYALERLSQDNEAQRQTIVNVICAYLRMPFPPQPPVVMPAPNGTADANEVRAGTGENPGADSDVWQQERQVRLTAQRILSEHLRKADYNQRLTSHSVTRFWGEISLDLTGATLVDFDLTDCMVTSRARFDGATFTGDAWFGSATFSGGAEFDGATFSGGASFGQATFSGDASFGSATFSGDAWFVGATFSDAAFIGATFSDAAFIGTTFSGRASFGQATFGRATFSGATFSGDALFGGVTFSGAAEFDEATFSGAAELDGVTFSGAARFDGATFTGDARFDGTIFSGAARFDGATFLRRQVRQDNLRRRRQVRRGDLQRRRVHRDDLQRRRQVRRGKRRSRSGRVPFRGRSRLLTRHQPRVAQRMAS